jgi:hypothetical protein
MSMFLLPKTSNKKMEKIMRSFFWQGGKLKKKISLGEMGKSLQIQEKGVWVLKILGK